jgi:cation diffusion facilitator family transporter
MNDRKAKFSLRLGFLGNLVLVVVKFAAGVVGHSQALIADGLNSLLDLVAGAVALIGYRVAAKPADRTHHYGHQNAETVAALMVGLTILAAGGIIVRNAIGALASGDYDVPAVWTIWVAAGVIVVKLLLYIYTRKVALVSRSPVVDATAADHYTDMIATGGALAGLIGSQFGMPYLDPIAAFWVAAIILYHALRIIRQHTSILLGGAPPEETTRAIVKTLCAVPGVKGLHRLKVRTTGAHYLVDTEILVEGSMTVEEAHTISNNASDRVLADHPEVIDVAIHVEPHTAERAAEGADPLLPRDKRRGNPIPNGENE